MQLPPRPYKNRLAVLHDTRAALVEEANLVPTGVGEE